MYFAMLILLGGPVIILEMFLGQYSGRLIISGHCFSVNNQVGCSWSTVMNTENYSSVIGQ